MSEELVIRPTETSDPVLVEVPPTVVMAEVQRTVHVRDAGERTRAVIVATPPSVAALDWPARPVVVLAGFSGQRGLQGPKGDPGGSGVLARPVGAVVQGLRVVRALAGVIYPVDQADDTHASQVIGLALQSVTVIGSDVNVQLSGPVTDSSWNWSPGFLFCGADGALTQASPDTGWLLQVARVISADTIDIDLSYPIYRG